MVQVILSQLEIYPLSNSSLIKGNIFIICGGSLTISENSEIGESINAPVVLYSKGDASLTNSTVYGLIVSKGDSLVLNGTRCQWGYSKL